MRVFHPQKDILNVCLDKSQYDGAKATQESAYTLYLNSESAFRTAEVSINVAVISPD